MTIIIKRLNPNCGCEYQALYDKTDNLIFEGDYYHDHIEDKIDGFIEGIHFLGHAINFEEISGKCPYCYYENKEGTSSFEEEDEDFLHELWLEEE